MSTPTPNAAELAATLERNSLESGGGASHVLHRAARSAATLLRTQAARIAELEADAANLRTVMIAAAEEIHAHWEAHCDADGYGPANLMHRLENGIPSQYLYTAGEFARLREQVAAVAQQVPEPQAETVNSTAVAYIRVHPDGTYTDEMLPAWKIEPVRRDSGAWKPLVSAPLPTPEKPA